MIRAYTNQDKEELIALLKLNIPAYFAEEEEADFVEYLEQHLEDYFVVEENDKLIAAGGLNYFPESGESRISWDVVHPDYQGKGIGRKLTQHRINHVRQNPQINLLIVRTTQLVYKFYEKMGFSLAKTEKDFWAKGFDLYQLHMPLRGN
ncbi:GNAT family N-acetyltransferase [Pontibacter sp. H249]|uniref:GNAT family N-acetyltransferase n=1 Tax=Pontibacter sp. H249 TaxID=3133420 RepID=UPI0030BD7B7D